MLLPLQKIDIIQVINFKYGWYNKFKKEQNMFAQVKFLFSFD